MGWKPSRAFNDARTLGTRERPREEGIHSGPSSQPIWEEATVPGGRDKPLNLVPSSRVGKEEEVATLRALVLRGQLGRVCVGHGYKLDSLCHGFYF